MCDAEWLEEGEEMKTIHVEVLASSVKAGVMYKYLVVLNVVGKLYFNSRYHS